MLRSSSALLRFVQGLMWDTLQGGVLGGDEHPSYHLGVRRHKIGHGEFFNQNIQTNKTTLNINFFEISGKIKFLGYNSGVNPLIRKEIVFFVAIAQFRHTDK